MHKRFRNCLRHIIHCNGHGILLSATASVLLLTMCYGTLSYSASRLDAQSQSNAVLAMRLDQVINAQQDEKTTVKALNDVVQGLRDRLNQMQGMLIGFGGFAALLQILNTIVQIKGVNRENTKE